MNELNARRIEFRNNRRELLDLITDLADEIDANRLLRKIKLSSPTVALQTDLGTLNRNIDALIIQYNRT